MHVVKTPCWFDRKVFKMTSKWNPEGTPKPDKNRNQTVISVVGRALFRVRPQPLRSWILTGAGVQLERMENRAHAPQKGYRGRLFLEHVTVLPQPQRPWHLIRCGGVFVRTLLGNM